MKLLSPQQSLAPEIFHLPDSMPERAARSSRKTHSRMHSRPQEKPEAPRSPFNPSYWNRLPRCVRNSWEIRGCGKGISGRALFTYENSARIREGRPMLLAVRNLPHNLKELHACPGTHPGEISIRYRTDNAGYQLYIGYKPVHPDSSSGRWFRFLVFDAGKEGVVSLTDLVPEMDYELHVFLAGNSANFAEVTSSSLSAVCPAA
jgi:hypothetical protein